MSEPVVHVIDDDDSAREALAFLLTSSDFEVETYASALAFLKAMPTARPGVVVSDIRMPEMTGLELAQRLSGARHDFAVVIMTGHGDIPMAVEAMRGGVVDFLESPSPRTGCSSPWTGPGPPCHATGPQTMRRAPRFWRAWRHCLSGSVRC